MLPLQLPIVAVSGGRDVQPTQDEIARLSRALYRRRVRVVRLGACPTGVDAAIQAWAEALPADLERGRGWVWEQWQADWNRHGNAAGPMRNRAMLEGDGMLCGGVFTVGGLVSKGPASALIHWPGGKGTASAVTEAKRLGVRVVPIASLA